MSNPFIPHKPTPKFLGVELDDDTADMLQYVHARTRWTKTALTIFALRHTFGEDPPNDPRVPQVAT